MISGHLLPQAIRETVKVKRAQTRKELRFAIIDAIDLCDRYAWSLAGLPTIDADAPVDITIGAGRFRHAENWAPALLTVFAKTIGVELIFTKHGPTKRLIHVVGREGVRAAFTHMCPFIVRSMYSVAEADRRYDLDARARVEANKTLEWLTRYTEASRDDTPRKKLGRHRLVDENRNMVVKLIWFDGHAIRHPKGRWVWADFLPELVNTTVDLPK